jgi:hypothetical protein
VRCVSLRKRIHRTHERAPHEQLLLDIDAPETFHADCEQGLKVGLKAKARLAQLLWGQTVYIDRDGRHYVYGRPGTFSREATRISWRLSPCTGTTREGRQELDTLLQFIRSGDTLMVSLGT